MAGVESGFSFPDFSSIDGLNLVGEASQLGTVMRLNPASTEVRGGMWYADKQPVASGFDTTFLFQVTDLGNGGADGLAFVVQNESAFSLGGHTGYVGICNSLAVEYDTWDNSPQWPDQGDNNVSVQSNGTGPNDFKPFATLGAIGIDVNMSDGNLHTGRVLYVPGTVSVFIDDLDEPVLSVDVELDTLLDLDNGKAWVGITGGTGAAYENHDIVSWSFETNGPTWALPFADDFSIEKGWVNDTGGDYYRDPANEWVSWHVSRSREARYYMPIERYSGDFRIEARLKATDWNGNANFFFGLADELTGSYSHPNQPTGLFVDFNWYGGASPPTRVRTYATYPDRERYISPVHLSYSMSQWYRVVCSVTGLQWTIELYDDAGNLVGEVSDVFPAGHSGFDYILLWSPDTGGEWPTGDGLFDDLVVEGLGVSYSISGQVMDDEGEPVPEVTVSATGGYSAVTDAAGEYTITDLPAGTYTLMPSKAGYTFDPETREVEVPPDAMGQDFTAVAGNLPPELGVDEAEVTTGEGDEAANSGSVHDPDGDPVTLGASVGEVIDHGDSTWSWSWATEDGPVDSQMVAVSADDGFHEPVTVWFGLVVENVAPTATAHAPSEVDEGDDIVLSLTDPYDPSPADTAAGFAYLFACGAAPGGGHWYPDASVSCPTYDNGTFWVLGRIRDKDRGATTYVPEVIARNVAPTAQFAAPDTVVTGSEFSLSLTDPYDPSTADTAAGFEYAFDCGAGDGDWGPESSITCTAGDAGIILVEGMIRDKDGGETEYWAIVTVRSAGHRVYLPLVRHD